MDDSSNNTNAPSPDPKHPNAERRIGRTRRAISILIIVVAIGGTAAYKYHEKTRPLITAGPMIQMPAPDLLAVVWMAQSPFGTGAVELSGPDGKRRIEQVVSSAGRYVAEFKGLTPNAEYKYTISNSGFLSSRAAQSGPHAIRIAPSRDANIRFIAFGDSGIGSNTQALLAETMAKESPDVIVHTGDLIYPAGAEKDYLPNFFRPYKSLLATTFFMPSLGNHDVATDRGAPLLRQFILPENGPAGIEAERNYWFDYGPARFVALDSNLDANGGAMKHAEMKSVVADWLRKTLTDCDATWRIVFFHHPFYTGSAHTAESSAYVKDAYLDAIEAAGVDVVLCGHNHLYERIGTMRADNVVGPGEGVLYITTGAGGAQRYEEKPDAPNYVQAFNDGEFSFTRVDLTPTTLTLQQVGESGSAFDKVVLTK